MSKKKKSRSASKAKSPAENATSYQGPVAMPRAMLARATVEHELTATTTVTSTAGGVINNVFVNSPAGSSEFSSLALLFEEYRVLGFEIHFVPFYPHWGSTTALAQNQAPLVHWPQRNAGTAAPTTYTGAYQYAGAKVSSIQDEWRESIKMSGTLESEWVNTSAPISVAAVAVFGSGFSNSIQYGIAFSRWLLQMRSPT